MYNEFGIEKQADKIYMWSISLYVPATWPENNEMSCWTRIDKIKWADNVSNEDVRRRDNEK